MCPAAACPWGDEEAWGMEGGSRRGMLSVDLRQGWGIGRSWDGAFRCVSERC